MLYVYSTYDSGSGSLKIAEWVIAALFGIDYVFGLRKARDKKKFLMHPMNCIDLLTIMPVLIYFLGVRDR